MRLSSISEFRNQLSFQIFRTDEFEKHSSYFAQARYIFQVFPLVFNRIFFQFLIKSSPSYMEIDKSFPDGKYLPNHIGLVLSIEKNVVPYPPEIPQPYLTAERKIKVPEKAEISKILALRAEFFTQQKSHIAAEKVRLLTEISRISIWSYKTNKIKELSIYDQSTDGELFKNLDLKDLANSIVAELYSLNGGKKCSIPAIKLLNMYNREELTINLIDPLSAETSINSGVNHSGGNLMSRLEDVIGGTFTGDTQHIENSNINSEGESIFSPNNTQVEQELTVYLIVNELPQTLVHLTESLTGSRPIEKANESVKSSIGKLIESSPRIPQLILKPHKKAYFQSLFNLPIVSTKTYIPDAIDNSDSDFDSEPETITFYIKNERFSYSFFIRSLFHYSLSVAEDS